MIGRPLLLAAVASALLGLAALVGLLWFNWRGGLVERYESARVLANQLADHIAVSTPAGDGPFPTIIMFHGCGGLKSGVRSFAEEAARRGYLAIAVDSFAHRGVTEAEALAGVCSGVLFRGDERAGDVIAALQHVRARQDVDQGRIVLAGWSHGAWAIMDAFAFGESQPPPSLKVLPENPFRGVIGTAMFYPYCGFPAQSRDVGWRFRPGRAAFFLVKDDAVTPSKDCLSVIDRLRGEGLHATVDMFEGVTHGFDEPDHAPVSTLEYDPEATERARRRFFQRIDAMIGEAS